MGRRIEVNVHGAAPAPAGFQNHASKPMDPQELVFVVANLAGRYA